MSPFNKLLLERDTYTNKTYIERNKLINNIIRIIRHMPDDSYNNQKMQALQVKYASKKMSIKHVSIS